MSWYNKTRKIQKSLQYNEDLTATVIHHLRDTEEQQKYNDEHYEMWGFNLDGTFEYGKYVIFVTKEQHTEIHAHSDETRKKLSIANKGKFVSEDTRKKISIANKKLCEDTAFRLKKSQIMHEYYKNNPVSDKLRHALSLSHLGKVQSEETKEKRSNSLKLYHSLHLVSQETRLKISGAISGKNHPQYGKVYSKEEKDYFSVKSKLSREGAKILYNIYKHYGGCNTWNQFQANLKMVIFALN